MSTKMVADQISLSDFPTTIDRIDAKMESFSRSISYSSSPQGDSMPCPSKKMKLSALQQTQLLQVLEERFQQFESRHEGIAWAKVQARLEDNPDKLWSLQEMERTGGEPDVVGHDRKTGEYVFFDCAEESPQGRRSVCYDRAGLESRKEHRPADSAVEMAAAMGIELLTEEEYRQLQTLGQFDLKTSSWVATPASIRKLGGALFGDRRYGQVFIYHNGAQSYYAARGFRGLIRV
jgi:hypothetical protein